MVFITITTILCIIFICIDIIPIYRNKQWMEFWIYLPLIAATYALVVILALGIKIPSPAGPLKKIVSLIWGL